MASYDAHGRVIEEIQKPENPDAGSDGSWLRSVYVRDAAGRDSGTET
jgi:hypothetical protein